MRPLAGHNLTNASSGFARDYQALPGDGGQPGPANPFGSEAGDSDATSVRSRESEAASIRWYASSRRSSRAHPYGPTVGTASATTLGSAAAGEHQAAYVQQGADADVLPLGRRHYPSGSSAGFATKHAGVSYTTLNSAASESRTNSMYGDQSNSSTAYLVNPDMSPFGGYPASDFPLRWDEKEADDYLHNPDPELDAKEDRKCHKLDRRGWGCLAAFVLLASAGLFVFVVLPVLAYTGKLDSHISGGHGSKSADRSHSGASAVAKVGERLSLYDYKILSALRSSLIDPDTPQDARTHKSRNGDEWQLVFSDEFNVDGRTFYNGDDPIWQAVDLHYAATTDLEWYCPDAATTANGSLRLRLDAFPNHDLFYRSAMLQTWNRLCFTQGYIEVAARLPGSGSVPGLWPGLWTLGNLARPGYLATSQGVWPYAYNECDAGITPNQSQSDGLSFLPGQRLNKCTCKGEMHPSPGIGRGAPEIDILEGTVSSGVGIKACGVASQSLQLAPFDIWYYVDYNFIEIYNASVTKMNTWTGGPVQEAVSGTTYLNNDWYQQGGEGAFQTYAYEYTNDDDTGYISWFVGKSPTFTMLRQALGPNGNIGNRQISKEPMSIILNLGISNSWTYIDWLDLVFPVILEIDYVRIYQPSDAINLSCDPPDYPTLDYINAHPLAYNNPNYTTWESAGYSFPKNSLMHGCT